MIAKDSNSLKAYVGSTSVSKMYKGDTLVYSSAPPVLPDYLYFTALESGTFTLTIGSYVSTTSLQYIEYSVDEGKTWVKTSNVASTTVTVTTPAVQAGDKVLWRGEGVRLSQSNSSADARCCVFSATCDFNVGGILMSLVAGADVAESSRTSSYGFSRLFYGNSHVVDAGELILPPNTNANCFDYFFYGCTSLVKGPQMRALTITGNYVFRQFYAGCTSLVEAPVLPVLSLVQGCYYQMFMGDKALRWVMCLATDKSATNCLFQWFTNATNTSEGVFVKHIDATWTTSGVSGVLSNWTIIYYDPSEDKYYTDQTKTTECDDHGNVV